MDQPAWLAAALEGAPQASDLPPVSGEPLVGDIWLAEADGQRVLVAINLVPDPGAHWSDIVNACLVHTDLDLASDQTLRFDLGEPGIPFSLLVQCDIVGPVLIGDLRSRIGRLPVDEVTFRHATLLGEYEDSLRGRRGIALRGPDDPRWDFTIALLDRFDPFIARADATMGW